MGVHAPGKTTQKPAPRTAWEQPVLPRKLRQLNPDLVHGLAYAVPAAWPGPSVVSIYDLSFLLFPKAFKAANRIYLAAATRATAQRAPPVLTITERARSNIVRLLTVPEAYVDVTSPAVKARYQPLPAATIEAFK